MFLTLNHQKLDVYQASKSIVLECYRLSRSLPSDEKFGMISKIRKAALSHLNVAEGCSRKSEAERKRFYEIARGSVIEIDAAVDIAKELHYPDTVSVENLGNQMIKCFKLLTGLIDSKIHN